MTGILNCLIGTFRPSGLVIGQAYEGGFYAGQISTSGNGVATHNLVLAPKSSGSNTALQWKTSNTDTTGTSSVIDGPTNSSNMNNASHPAAQFCEGLSIGGFSDWYLPAKNELEVVYYNLKPTTASNNTGYGANTNAVPSRPSNYTTTVPAQTTATDFQSGGTEAIPDDYFWSSTQDGTSTSGAIRFDNGIYAGQIKTSLRATRAVRRVAV